MAVLVGVVVLELHTRTYPSWQGTVIMTVRILKLISVSDTVSPVEGVDDVSRDLVTLITSEPQGVDSVHEILLDWSPWQTAALRLSHSGLEIFSVCQVVSLYSSLTSSSPGGQMAMLVRVVWAELQTLVKPS